jgi:hypothetical protein
LGEGTDWASVDAIKVIKLARLVRLSKVMKKMEREFNGGVQLGQMAVAFLLILHWITCFWLVSQLVSWPDLI